VWQLGDVQCDPPRLIALRLRLGRMYAGRSSAFLIIGVVVVNVAIVWAAPLVSVYGAM